MRALLSRALTRRRGADGYSHLREQEVIVRYLAKLDDHDRVCVDIGASDGIEMSNSYALYLDGWTGLAVEPDAAKFARLAAEYRALRPRLMRVPATPTNIGNLLAAAEVPREFGFLTLDIDGYDYFVLEALLEDYRPRLMCVEVNEKVPPPLKFTVNYDPEYTWDTSHFYGQSISQLETLARRTRYALLELHYNNAFLAPAELDLGEPLTAEEAYRRGYRDQPDRRERFPWNADMEWALAASPEEALERLDALFAPHRGTYTLAL